MDRDRREELKREVDKLPNSHVEQVFQHARELRQIPESADLKNSSPKTQLDAGEPDSELVWVCANCKNEFARPLDDMNRCPHCGAPREELTLREANSQAA